MSRHAEGQRVVTINGDHDTYLAPRREPIDAERFDDLARTQLTAPSRRGVLAGLASGLLALLSLARGGEDVEGKRKKGKRKKKKKKKRPAPPAVSRQVVTQIFANTGAIFVPGTGTEGPANPYPSTIAVSGFTNGVITDVNVLLNNFNYSTFPHDVDVLLAANQISGRNAIVMSDVGGDPGEVNVNLVLDDQPPTALPANNPLVIGTYQPTNLMQGTDDAFPAPAPIPIGNSELSTFHGQDPNGTWQLFVVDDTSGDSGNFAGGWAIQITAEVNV